MEKEILNKYDEYVNRTYINLITIARRNNNKLILKNFNSKDEKHLFVLAIARTISKLNGFILILEMPFYKKIFNKKISKIKTINHIEKGIIIEEFLNFTGTGLEVTPEEIYEEYYK